MQRQEQVKRRGRPEEERDSLIVQVENVKAYCSERTVKKLRNLQEALKKIDVSCEVPKSNDICLRNLKNVIYCQKFIRANQFYLLRNDCIHFYCRMAGIYTTRMLELLKKPKQEIMDAYDEEIVLQPWWREDAKALIVEIEAFKIPDYYTEVETAIRHHLGRVNKIIGKVWMDSINKETEKYISVLKKFL